MSVSHQIKYKTHTLFSLLHSWFMLFILDHKLSSSPRFQILPFLCFIFRTSQISNRKSEVRAIPLNWHQRQIIICFHIKWHRFRFYFWGGAHRNITHSRVSNVHQISKWQTWPHVTAHEEKKQRNYKCISGRIFSFFWNGRKHLSSSQIITKTRIDASNRQSISHPLVLCQNPRGRKHNCMKRHMQETNFYPHTIWDTEWLVTKRHYTMLCHSMFRISIS